MLDERWSEDVEVIGDTLRKMLVAESSPERVRAAEENGTGIDAALEARLEEFGLNELEADAELFARIAFELGRALAPTAYTETIPCLALLGRPGLALDLGTGIPLGANHVAVPGADGVVVRALSGAPRRSAAGEWRVMNVDVESSAADESRIGDAALSERLRRLAALISAARLAGAAQGLLNYGVNYAREREQFGKVIATFQGVSHRLARCAGEADAAELLVRKAAFSALPAAQGDGAPAPAFALMVQAKAVEAARFVATNVHQVFGGNGFAMEYDVQLFSRRIRTWAGQSPRPDALLANLGRLVLTPKARDGIVGLWHNECGVALPRWAIEGDRLS